MIRVVIESPFGRNLDGSICTPLQYERNRRYLNRALKDSLARGEAPYASHRFYPGLLDDSNLEERKQGIEAGLLWALIAHHAVLYTDHGINESMQKAYKLHKARGLLLEHRQIGPEPEVLLLDCPFCGVCATSIVHSTEDGITNMLAVRCIKCGTLGPVAINEDAANEAWNRRS